MPYYARGDYYRGDYYRGDIFGVLKKVVGGVASVAGKVLPGPIGAVAKIASAALNKPKSTAVVPISSNMPVSIAGFAPSSPPPIIKREFTAGLLPPTITSTTEYGAPMAPGSPFFTRKKRRAMNPLNVKALRRASRRVDSFVRTTRKALKHTGFTIVSRASRRGGSPGIITRSEAARALKK